MNQLFLDRVENLISVIDLDLPEIFLDTLGKTDLEHLCTFAYADGPGQLRRRQASRPQEALGFHEETNPNDFHFHMLRPVNFELSIVRKIRDGCQPEGNRPDTPITLLTVAMAAARYSTNHRTTKLLYLCWLKRRADIG